MTASPVLVLAFNRPKHLRRAIESLRDNRLAGDTPLVISCDGPRQADDEHLCAAVQAYARTVSGFASVDVWTRKINRGLSGSVISGVSTMLDRTESTIVVEDDLEVSPHFLQFMNDGLACYSADLRVASVHGYCYPTEVQLPETYFVRGADCWGWATWRRAWQHFNPNGGQLRDRLVELALTHAFDYEGTYPFFRMLEDQIAGRNDSWAIRWHATCFLKDMLTLYPGRSLVHNFGNDGSGTHGSATRAFDQHVARKAIEVHRIDLQESPVARAAFVEHFRATSATRSTLSRAGGKLLAAIQHIGLHR
jgi:hypothetical protein